MEQILTIAAFIVMGLLLLVAVVSNLTWLLAKEKRRKITVVRKRETLYPNRRYYGGSGNRYTTHYTVDCLYPEESGTIHTFGCSYDIFRQMKEGKSYAASIKCFEILSISKK